MAMLHERRRAPVKDRARGVRNSARRLVSMAHSARPGQALRVRAGTDTAPQTLYTHAGDDMFSRILVPIDFSPPSDAALDYARILAAKFGSTMRILHVVDDPSASSDFVG